MTGTTEATYDQPMAPSAHPGPQPVAAAPTVRDLLAAYRPSPGVFDEMLTVQRRVRPGWRQFAGAFGDLAVGELPERFQRADQYLRDAGVFYRVYGSAGAFDREWPLAHLPFIIDEGEWLTITHGLRQRLDLMEAVVSDLYGANRIVAAGLLPPALIADNPAFLRPMVGTRPKSGHFLHFCAFDLARSPRGGWWVLGDRTQAPSGAGFALENRVATTRAFPDAYRAAHVHRVAGFFGAFRDALQRLSGNGGNAQAAILTPGPGNETYYEHAYIARYLGLLLLEGEDLTVENGAIMVRTVNGPQPIDVLWRRIDAEFMDPLEFRQDSRIGTPGIAEALRDGAAVMVNALGSGILETRALLAFLPRLCKALRGEELVLPNIATWWCGQEAEREQVIAGLDRMMIGPAFSSRLPFEDGGSTVPGAGLDAGDREALIDRLRGNGADFVGQEAVRLSTTPVFVDGRLEPRPLILRMFAARSAEGWSFLPGGLARVGRSADNAAIAMQQGGRAADVWVVSQSPVEKITLLAADGHEGGRSDTGFLPSRTADNLFWLGRYVERAEETMRLLRAYHSRLGDAVSPDEPLFPALRTCFEAFGIDAETPIAPALRAAIAGAVASAGRIRDRFSPDGWAALGDLAKTAEGFSDRVAPGDDGAKALSVLIRKVSGFSGLVQENMYRSVGWRFLDIGRRIERAIQAAHVLSHLGRADAPAGSADFLLEVGDVVLTARRIYPLDIGWRSALELMALDPQNPRSIVFQLGELAGELARLPAGPDGGERHAGLVATAQRLEAELTALRPATLTAERLAALRDELADLAQAVGDAYL